MEVAFEAKPVLPDQLRMAYAVMLLDMPEISFPEFRKWAGGSRGAALNGIFDQRGYIHGIFRNRVETRPVNINRFVVFDLILSDAISSTLVTSMLDALLRAARLRGCDQMTVEATRQHKYGHKLMEMLANRGFVDECVLMARQL